MLNNNDFISLERRLWLEGNPLTDELVSTRDELLHLLKQANSVVKKYSPMISTLADPDDVDYWREYDNFLDTLDNISYDLGVTE
jgi:hypothetical protein